MAKKVMKLASTPGDQLRALLNTISSFDDLGNVRTDGEIAAQMIDDFHHDSVLAAATGELTVVGLRARRRTLGEPLVLKAESLQQQAQQIARQLKADFDSEWRRLSRPTTDVLDEMKVRHRQELLASSLMPLILLKMAIAANTPENDELVRAALLFPANPLGADGGWKPLVSEDQVKELQQAVRERVSPQGPLYWQMTWLKEIANHLRSAVQADMDVDSLRRMAAGEELPGEPASA